MDVDGFLITKKKIKVKNNVRSHFIHKTVSTVGIPLGKNGEVENKVTLKFVFRKLASACHWNRRRKFDIETFLQQHYLVKCVN